MEWSNWAGNVVTRPKAIGQPSSLDELRDMVTHAATQEWRIRVAGSGHSFAPLCQTDGLLLDLANMRGLESVDALTGDATIWAGSKIHELGKPLLEHGRAFANQGDIDRQAIAGAVATGTHGTGRRFGSFSSMLRALEFMTPNGEIVSIDSSSSRDELDAASLNLGMLGVVTKLRLATVPAYKLLEENRSMNLDSTLAEFPEIESKHRTAEFWWIPPLDTCVIKTLSSTLGEPFEVATSEYPPGSIGRYLKPNRVDWSYRTYPSPRLQPFVECEFAFPISEGPDVMRSVRNLMLKNYPEVHWAVEYRTLPGERHLLSPTANQDCVSISVHQGTDQDWEPFMRHCFALFMEAGGRPHWGKLHWLEKEDVDRLYPAANQFRLIRSAYDPEGAFLNDHLSLFQ